MTSTKYVSRTQVPDERGGTSYEYRTEIVHESGSCRSRPGATELEWIDAELARLDDVRAEDDPTEQDFLDALEVAEILRCRLADLEFQA